MEKTGFGKILGISEHRVFWAQMGFDYPVFLAMRHYKGQNRH